MKYYIHNRLLYNAFNTLYKIILYENFPCITEII